MRIIPPLAKLRKLKRKVGFLAAAWAVLCCAGTVRADVDEAQFRRDLTALAGEQTRAVGTAGYYRAAEYIESQLRTLPNVQYRRHEYSVMAPITQSATLRRAGARDSESV